MARIRADYQEGKYSRFDELVHLSGPSPSGSCSSSTSNSNSEKPKVAFILVDPVNGPYWMLKWDRARKNLESPLGAES